MLNFHKCHQYSCLLVQVEGKAVAYEPLSSNFDWVKIQDELQELGESMNCDVELEDVTQWETQIDNVGTG